MMTETQVAEAVTHWIGEVNPDVFVVEIRLKRGKISVLYICIDTDKGIRIDECASLSRMIGRRLEEGNVFEFPYNLEVTSPGLDQPLKVFRQYVKNIGRTLKVNDLDGVIYTGELSAVSEKQITLKPELEKRKAKKGEVLEETVINIDFEKIKSAKVQVSFK